MQLCVHTCTNALRIKPHAKQLLQLLRQAEENLRAGFLSERHREVSSAAQQAFSAAAEQVKSHITSSKHHTSELSLCQ
jgi:hypothetical protein